MKLVPLIVVAAMSSADLALCIWAIARWTREEKRRRAAQMRRVNPRPARPTQYPD
ncbi:MAG TPA: hypothetical protein VMV27_02065 [Candidatus Binataceae bacterium]|nr:hypothetical protein [Candidatus Binataceae bacterium]